MPSYGPRLKADLSPRGGEAHAHAEARAVDAGQELDACAVRLRDTFYDGQAQAAAALARPGNGVARELPAVEAVEHPLVLRGRNAGTAVADPERGASTLPSGGYVDPATARGVTQGVVDQVAEQGAQRLAVAAHGCRRRLAQAEVDLPLRRQRRELLDHFARERGEIDPLRCALAAVDARLGAGEREQLFGQPRRALETGLEIGQRPESLDVGRGALGELRLQVDCSERRAQLVRRVGDEGALRRKGLAEALQQSV